MPSRDDSSRSSPMPSILFSFESSAIFIISWALLTANGISSITIATWSLKSSKCVFARTITLPRPVRCAFNAPARPIIMPPVGKSGPGIIRNNSSPVIPGLSSIATRPVMTSRKLYVGMFVAMPTAMPDPPFIRRFGNFAGRTRGSCNPPSKFGIQSTVSLSKSSIRSAASFVRRASVYRIAAAPSPSRLPKLPWPKTRRSPIEKS